MTDDDREKRKEGEGGIGDGYSTVIKKNEITEILERLFATNGMR